MAKYNVVSPVDHDGVHYEVDSEIDVTGKSASQLLEQGVIEERKKKPAETNASENAGKPAGIVAGAVQAVKDLVSG